MHRRSLPIAAPCQVFRPTPETSFCDHCSTHVHDLSAMTKRAAMDLLASNVGQKICISYRTSADGTLLHRPEVRAVGGAAGSLMALGLAACAAHAPEMEHPGEGCRDPQGYDVDCERPRRSEPQIPDADLTAADPEVVDAPEAIAEVPGVPNDPTLVEETGVSRDFTGLILPDPVVAAHGRDYGGGVVITEHRFAEIERFEIQDAKSKRAARRAARRERRSR